MNYTSARTKIEIALPKRKHGVPNYRINTVRIEKRPFEMSQICVSTINSILEVQKQQRLSEIVIYIPNDNVQNNQ